MVLLVGLPHEVSADCTGPVGSEARMIYNYDCHVLQYCDGTDWVLVGRKNPACDDTTSDPFAFTDQIGAALSTLTNSNIVQISGIHAAAPSRSPVAAARNIAPAPTEPRARIAIPPLSELDQQPRHDPEQPVSPAPPDQQRLERHGAIR